MIEKIEIEYLKDEEEPVFDYTNRVLAVFQTIPNAHWSEVLHYVNRYLERMNVIPRPPGES